jgi:hypothetical protein
VKDFVFAASSCTVPTLKPWSGGLLRRPGTLSDAPDPEIRTPDPQDTP